ncbi:hypothetical protein LTS18_014725, partial [Coniosporium uncinatum]
DDDPNFFRLAPGKVVGLLNVPFAVKATSFTKDDATGRVTEIRASKVDVDAEGGGGGGGVKPKGFIHWVSTARNVPVTARQYNALFKSEEPNGLDWKNGGWADDLNPESEIAFEDAVVEVGIGELRKGEAKKADGGSDDLVRFQAVRTGYFCIDTRSGGKGDAEGEKLVLNEIVSLKEDAGKVTGGKK